MGPYHPTFISPAAGTPFHTNATPKENFGWIEQLGSNELEFFEQQTGIENEAALKDHIISVQAKAYKIYPYPCIKHFGFAT